MEESTEAFLEHFSFVVSFLHREGFYIAEKTLLREFESKYQHAQEDGVDEGNAVTSAGSLPNASVDEQGYTQLVRDEYAGSRTAEVASAPAHNAGSSSEPEPVLPESQPLQAPVPILTPQPLPISATNRKYEKRRSRTTWDPELCEYENMDDIGYVRRDVSGQAHFIESELDMNDEKDEKLFTHAPGRHVQDDVDIISSDEDNDDEHDEDEHCYSGSNNVSNNTLSAQASSPQDKEWDKGPEDIKLTEPVTTPTKDLTQKSCDEPRPVLSRVESLSSSFMDFDIERDAGTGEDCGGLSSRSTGDNCLPEFCIADLSGNAVSPGEVEPSASKAREGEASFGSSKASASPEEVAAAGARVQASCGAIAEPEANKEATGDQTKSTKQKAQTGSQAQGAPAFSFQFPLTPKAPPAAEPDAPPLFKSWTSARSSCSEFNGVEEDDNPNEYADDEYRSRMSSREPSITRSSAHPDATELSATCRAISKSKEAAAEVQQRSGMVRSGSHAFITPVEPPGEEVKEAAAATQGPTQCQGADGEKVFDGGASTTEKVQADDAEAVPAPTDALAEPTNSLAEPTDALAEPTDALAEPSSSLTFVPPLPGAGPVAHEIKISQEDMEEHESIGMMAEDSESPGMRAASGGTTSTADDQPDMVSGGVRALSSDTAEAVAAGDAYLPDADATCMSANLAEEQEPQPLEWQVVVPEVVGGREAKEEEEEDADDGNDDDDTETSGIEDAEAYMANMSQTGTSQVYGPSYSLDENGAIVYEYDMNYIERKYEVFDLRIIHRRHHTGFEETKDFPIRMNDLIAGRYQVMDFLGSAAFSRAVQAMDVKTGQLVCLKIIKNNKDYFDQSLDEIKLLKFVNSMDPHDQHGLVRLYDYFYYKEHLFLVCELLRANLYEFQKYNRESNDEPYFTNARIQRITISVLRSLAFMHSLGLVHSDLKPENILIKSYSRCEVKVIDLGSSCFVTDQLSSYVQSRSYRAPEVILGLPYDQKIDVWSLGCILAELSSGYVLFQNDSLASLLARLEGILGPVPSWMIQHGRYSSRFYTRSGQIYERSPTSERYETLAPKRTSLAHRMPEADKGLVSFVNYLLSVDPRVRPTAIEALSHPWLHHQYPSLDSN